jgi:hypothetical protein
MSASASPGSFFAKNSGVLQPQHHRQDTLCWNSVLPAPHRTIHGHGGSSALQGAGVLCNRCSHTAQTVLTSSSPGKVQRQLDAIQRQRHCPAAILPHQPRCGAHHRIQHAPCRREDPVWRRPGRLFETPVPAYAAQGGHSLMSWCREWCLQPGIWQWLEAVVGVWRQNHEAHQVLSCPTATLIPYAIPAAYERCKFVGEHLSQLPYTLHTCAAGHHSASPQVPRLPALTHRGGRLSPLPAIITQSWGIEYASKGGCAAAKQQLVTTDQLG